MPSTLTPEGTVLAVVMMRKIGNRARLLLLIAGAPYDDEHYHDLSSRSAARYLGLSVRYAHALFVELVAAGVIERRPGAGSRSDSWRVRGDVARWAVLWPARRDPDHVRLILEAGGHVLDVVPVTKSPVARGSIAQREADFARGFIAERSRPVARGSIAQRGPGGLRAGPDTRATPPPLGVAAGAESSPTNGLRMRRSEADLNPMAAEWLRQLGGVIYRRTGRPVIGRGADRLGRLFGALSIEGADRCLSSLPDGAGWGVVLGALEAAARAGELPSSNGHARPDVEPPPLVPVEERSRVLARIRAERDAAAAE